MKKIIIFIIFILLIITGYRFVKKKINNIKSKSEHTKEKTEKVRRKNLVVSILCSGKVEPYIRVEVNPPAKGRIDETYIEEGEKVRKGDILAKMSSDDRIILIDAARSILEDARKLGDEEKIRKAKTQLKTAENAYQPILITAPVDGTIIKKSAEIGQNINTSSVLFVISDRLIVNVEVDESDIGSIRKGQDVIISLDAFPDKKFKGKVYKISHESRIVSDVVIYDVGVEPVDVPSYWSAGMSASVDIITKVRKNAIVVSNYYLHNEDKYKFVFVKTDNGIIKRKITTGITNGKITEIKKGLRVGEEIVSENSSVRRNSNRKKKKRIRLRIR